MAINLDPTQGATEQVEDYTGGGGFIWNTGIHEVEITQCYCVVAKSGAQALHFRFKDANGKAYKEDLYFTSRTGSYTYEVKDKQKKLTGKKRHIPGFATSANIIACAFSDSFATYIANEENGADLNERYQNFFFAACASCKPGTVPKWDWPKKADVDTEVDDVMHNIVGKKINLAIVKKLVNKQEANAEGNYVDVAETKEENEINNAFSLEGFSAPELLVSAEAPAVMVTWSEANAGKLIDKRKIKDQAAPAAGAPASTAATTDNIFG